MRCSAERMRTCVLLVAVLAVAPAAVPAPHALDATSVAHASEHLTQQAAGIVAARWGVDASRVRIVWQDSIQDAVGAVALRGAGANGHWVLEVRAPQGVQQARFRAGVTEQVAVAARDLPRGIAIDTADVAWRDTIRWGPPARDPVHPAGWTTRRTLAAGSPLVPPAVAPPVWVRSGDDVTLIVVRGTLELSLAARAAGTGAAGDTIAVRAATGRRLTGTITAPGVVRVNAGR